MNVLVLTHNFFPDLSAASFRMESIVRELAKRDYKVFVITAYPNRYDNFQVSSNDDFPNNVKIFRVKNKKQSNNLVKRTFSYSEYFIKSYFMSFKLAKQSDIVIATSPQILTGFLGALLKKENNKFILDIRDLWPDTMAALNIIQEKSIIYKILKKIEIFMYKKADRIIINSPAFESHIKNYTNTKIDIITNGIDDNIYTKLANIKCNYDYTISDKIKVLYAGNLGIAQDIKILTELNKKILDQFEFHLIGNGSQKEEIQREILKKNLNNILIFPPEERNVLINRYKNYDAFFVHLKNVPMFSRTIPSKIFEYVATKKPVVYGLRGISKEIMDELNAGYPFESGNINSLEKALLKLKEDLYNKKWKYEENKFLKTKYLRSDLSKKFVDIIETLYD